MRWSTDVAYGVGLITTDGCLSGDGRHIEFSSKDLELVEYVRRIFELTNRICRKSSGFSSRRYFRVQFGNVVLYRWLCSIGLSPRKSLTIGALSIPDEFFADFLRGHLDGDGTISVYWDSVFPNSQRLYVRFYSGSRPHLDWIESTVERLWSLKGYQTQGVRVWRLNYAKGASLELLTQLYYNRPGLYLTRKFSIAEPFLLADAEVAELAYA